MPNNALPDVLTLRRQRAATADAAENERRATAQELAKRLEEVQLTFSSRVGEEGKLFGSVTSADIATQLAAQGFERLALEHNAMVSEVHDE